MRTILSQMLEKYKINNIDDEKNALKEIMQEVALCGLSRAGFFKDAAFYGGTALRMFYGIDRFSEDLNFTLIAPNTNFQLQKYFSVLEKEINSLGLRFTVEEMVTSADRESAFLKGKTLEWSLTFYNDIEGLKNIDSDEVVKIKIEVDTAPPASATFENKYRLLPYPYQVKIYDLPSLFAVKIHAVICRVWGARTKGRDLYDYALLLAKGATVNLSHLKARLDESGFFDYGFNLTRESLIGILNKRFEEIDFEQTRLDVIPFIKDRTQLDLWCKEFFVNITKELHVR